MVSEDKCAVSSFHLEASFFKLSLDICHGVNIVYRRKEILDSLGQAINHPRAKWCIPRADCASVRFVIYLTPS